MNRPSRTAQGAPRTGALAALICLAFFLAVPPQAGRGQPGVTEAKKTAYGNWKDPLPVPFSPLASGQEESAPGEPLLKSPSGEPNIDDWTRIVFQSFRDKNWEIYASYNFREEVWQPYRVTNEPASDVRPCLNRDATRIAFASDRGMEPGEYEIYTANFNGTGLQRLTADRAYDSYPTWSPAGGPLAGQIAFVSDRDGNPEIYRMNADGSGLARLTSDGAVDLSPAWSPDGRQIAWIRHLDAEYGAIYLMNADGSNPRPLTGGLRFLQNVNWSPTGTRLAFDYDGNLDGWNDLATIHANGTNRQVWRSGQNLLDYWASGWSLDETNLFFTEVNWIEYRQEYYITSARMGDYEFNSGTGGTWNYSRLDFYPKAAPADITMPLSQVNPLPTYAPAGGVNVSWEGRDPGPAGIYTIYIQKRVGPGGEWQDWSYSSFYDNQQKWEVYTGEPGSTVYFRSRAWDYADHWEDWPPGDGDASTTLYSWRLSGALTDNRGRPIPAALPQLTPAAVNGPITDPFGKFLALLTTPELQGVQLAHDGYGAFPPTALRMVNDRSVSFYLPPTDDSLANGGFEEAGSAWEGWAYTGSYTPTLVEGQSGLQAAQLGYACQAPCLAPAEYPHPSESGFPVLAIDSLNQVHMLWSGQMYSLRDANGNWSAPVNLLLGSLEAQAAQDSTGNAALRVDSGNTVHAAMGDGDLYYAQKPPGGAWTAATRVTHGYYPALAVDRQGAVYLTYSYGGTPMGVYFQKRLPSGAWQERVMLGESFARAVSDVAVGPDQTVHFVFNSDDRLKYRSLSPGGALSNWEYLTPDLLNYQVRFASPRLKVDANGGLHLVYQRPDNRQVYLYRPPGGKWTAPVVLFGQVWAGNMDATPAGAVHVVGVPVEGPQDSFFYYRKRPGQAGFETLRVPSQNSYLDWVTLAVDRRDLVHFAWNSWPQLVYRRSAWPEGAGQASLSQAVTVGENLQHPTLAFLSSLSADLPWSRSGYEVRISDGVSETLVLASQAGEPWSLHWIDMAPWAGQAVTVTFRLDQAAGEPYVHLGLDNVSLGSWLTPLVSSVDPSQVNAPLGPGVEVIIHGANFQPTPTVLLGSTPAAGVEWLDAETLRVRLPAGLPTGWHDVWVLNPGGQAAVLPAGLRVGHVLFLPGVNR